MIISELFEAPQLCPECGGISFSDLILAEKKDACYHKVKASAKVWPSAYASGRLVQCRKKGAANYGNKLEGVAEMDNRTASGDRQEQRNNSPEVLAKKDKEQQKRLRDISPERRKILRLPEPKQGVAEGSDSQLDINQLAAISDAALDAAYGYGRSSPGNTFGWQANLKSAAYAKQMIDRGATDIEAISDAIHKGWNVTARAFVQDPDQFDDTEKLKSAGKLEAKLQQREKLMNIGYAQLSDEEQEKDRVVARALLQVLTGQQGVAEEYELAGVDVAYELGRRAYREHKTIRDNPYSATKQARKYDEWEKGLERGKHDANDAKLFRSSMREQGMAADNLNELDMFAPVTTYVRLANGTYVAANWRRNQNLSTASNSASFIDIKPLAPAAAKQLGLDQRLNDPEKKYTGATTIASGGPIQASGPLADRTINVVDIRDPKAAKDSGVPDTLFGKIAQWAQQQGQKQPGVAEGEQQKGADYRDPKEVDYDDEYDAMVARVKKLAGLGPMKTVYDPTRRQYRNMPTAVQPKK